MSYDGSLITTVTRTGSVEDTMTLSYNSDLMPDAFSYAGDTQAYGYDADGLLTLAAPFAIDRRADNGLATTVTASGFSLVRDWSAYGEIDAADYGAYRYSVGRDLAGRIVELTETAGAQTHVRSFEYDSLGRLVRVTRDGALAESYDYDVQGNRIGYRAPIRGIDTTLATTFHPDDRLAASADTTYTYTADGYIASAASAEGTTTFAYTGLGELERVTLPSGREISYRYDAAGRRVARLVDGEIVERYLWADNTRLLATYDTTGTLTRRFIYADARVPYAVDTPAGRHFLAYDQVGSLKAVTNAGGSVVERHDYDSFGVPIEGSAPSTITGLGFAGGLTDPDTGLVLFGARDYDPKMGRWMAKDPIGFVGGDTNLYGYCLGDPVNLVDPSGLLTWGWGYTASGQWFGPGVAGSAMLVYDTQGNVGFAVSGGSQTGPIPAGSLSQQLQFTNASTIKDLNGLSAGGGGSIAPLPAPVSFGVEGWGATCPTGAYGGVNFQSGLGFGKIPWEYHGSVDDTKVIYLGNPSMYIGRTVNRMGEGLLSTVYDLSRIMP